MFIKRFIALSYMSQTDTNSSPKGSFDRYNLTEFTKLDIQRRFCEPDKNYEIDQKRVSDFDQVLEGLKGEPKFLRSNNGKLHIPHVIDFKSNRTNLKVFRKKMIQQSGLVILLIDASGSMDGFKIDTIRDLVADLMTSAENIPKIELRVFIYGGTRDIDYDTNDQPEVNDRLLIHEIENVEDCDQIVTIGTTPTPQAIHYLIKKFEDSHKNKTLLVLTDGSPSSYTVSYQRALLEIKRVLIKAESAKFNIFGCGFAVPDMFTQAMENSFRGNYVNLWTKKDIQKYLFTALEDFVRSIKN
jgi:uncharacterized protein YegL